MLCEKSVQHYIANVVGHVCLPHSCTYCTDTHFQAGSPVQFSGPIFRLA